ncbi:MAG: membrane dipeptidase [Anaerolineae bacterium]|nr:membrane dipeptidase [Anaerolineae bacterium]
MMASNDEHESRDWESFHQKAFFVDMHAHPTMPASYFSPVPFLSFFPPLKYLPFFPSFRRANQRDPDDLPSSRSYRGTSLSEFRTAFPLLQAGGADVVLTNAVVPEVSFLRAILGGRWNVRFVARLPLINRISSRYINPSYFDSTLNMMTAIETEVAEYNRFAEEMNRTSTTKRRLVEIVRSFRRLQEIRDMGGEGPIALIHAVEGAHSLQGDRAGKRAAKYQKYHLTAQLQADDEIKQEVMANLRQFCAMGVAYITVAHFYPNVVAAPCFPYPDYAMNYIDILGDPEGEQIHHDLALGLTPIGVEVIKEMFRLGMLVDVSHSTPRARASIYAIADEMNVDYQVIATHVGAYSINPSPYNLEDWEIEWIAQRKGIVGVILMPYWTQPQGRVLGIDFISRTIEHIRSVGGVNGDDVIAIGTDLDGATDPPDELAHFGQMPRLTERLMAENLRKEYKYSDELIEKILGGNAWRVLENGWRGNCAPD